MRGAIEKGHQTGCISHLKTFHGVFLAYAADHDGVLPVIDYWSGATSTNAQWKVWATVIQPAYIGTNDFAAAQLCPTVVSLRHGKPALNGNGNNWCYMVNNGIARQTPEGFYDGCRLGAVAAPANTVLLACSAASASSLNRQGILGAGAGHGYGTNVVNHATASFYAQVHGGKANVLFVDGHVAPYAFPDINKIPMWGN